MIFTPYPVSQQDHTRRYEICPLNNYRVVSVDQIPIMLPQSLRNKCIRAVIIGSGDQAVATHMINLLCVDENDLAVNQRPIICAMTSGNQIDLTAGIIHHGNWPGRSSYPGATFFQAIHN